MINARKQRTAKIIFIIAMLAIFSSFVLSANNPGHDTLYIEQSGDSVLTGNLNISYLLTAEGNIWVKPYLDIITNGTVVSSSPSRNTIYGTNSILEIDTASGGGLYLNKYGGVVYTGSPSARTDLNISGNLYLYNPTGASVLTVGNIAVCLANGTGCPTALTGANVTSVDKATGAPNALIISPTTGDVKINITIPTCTGNDKLTYNGTHFQCSTDQNTISSGSGNVTLNANAGYLPQVQNASQLNNSIIYQSGTRIGIGTTVPSSKLEINGTVNVTGTNPDIYVGGVSVCLSNGTNCPSDPFLASGGTITSADGYIIHTFTSSGTFTPNQAGTIEVLVVAGGGGGGSGQSGGGGGGGVLYNLTFNVTDQPYPVVVGNGGNGGVLNTIGSSGQNSSFAGMVAVGGGAGGGWTGNQNGQNGGSGGGAVDNSILLTGGSPTTGQGYSGGSSSTTYADPYVGGGGGGCGAAGGSAKSDGGNSAGGIGCQYSISGTSTYYAGGGGGGGNINFANSPGAGGNGGGGAGSSTGAGTAGTANTGGGGGGGAYDGGAGGNGGSGVVIIKYLLGSAGSGINTANVTSKATAGYIPQMQSNTFINNSAIYQSGSNIGIGTTTPTSALHVSGVTNTTYLTVASATAASCDLKAYTNGTVYCGTDANTDTNTYATNGSVAGTTTKTLTLQRNDGATFNINFTDVDTDTNTYSTNGSITGTTSKTLTIQRSDGATFNINFTDVDTDTNSGGTVTGTGTGGYITQFQSVSAINSSAIYQNGTNVGIGTTAATTLLDVRGNVSFNQTLYVHNNGDVSIGTSSYYAGTNVRALTLNGALYPTLALYTANTYRGALSATPLDIRLEGNGTIPVIINPSGGIVGIGTTAPGEELEIYSTGASVLRIRDSDHITNATAAYVEFGGTTNGNWNITGYVGDGASASTEIALGAYYGNLTFHTSSTGTLTERMRMTTNGLVGINVSNPSGAALHVSGDVKAASYLMTSDERLKKDIHEITGLATITALRGVSFNWTNGTSTEVGVIAQDVEKVLPGLVVTDENGYKSVKYSNLVAPLIESVKDLNEMSQDSNKEIDLLKEQIKQMQKEIDLLNQQVKR